MKPSETNKKYYNATYSLILVYKVRWFVQYYIQFYHCHISSMFIIGKLWPIALIGCDAASASEKILRAASKDRVIFLENNFPA